MGIINQVSTCEFLQKLSTVRAHNLKKVSSSVLDQKVGRISVSRGVHMSWAGPDYGDIYSLWVHKSWVPECFGDYL
jgi:hypothetical protein